MVLVDLAEIGRILATGGEMANMEFDLVSRKWVRCFDIKLIQINNKALLLEYSASEDRWACFNIFS